MTTFTFTLDPDEIDKLIASELRQCYESMATSPINWAERKDTLEALLVVLDHYMAKDDYETWYESIKNL